jgi:hypothetical protein
MVKVLGAVAEEIERGHEQDRTDAIRGVNLNEKPRGAKLAMPQHPIQAAGVNVVPAPCAANAPPHQRERSRSLPVARVLYQL